MAATASTKSVRNRARTLNMAMEKEREAIEEARAEHRNNTLAKRGKATSFHGLVERRTSAFEMMVTGENPSGAMFVDDRSKKSRPSTAPQSESRASVATPRSPKEPKKKPATLIQMNSKGELVAQPVAKEEPPMESPRSPRKMGYDAYNKYVRDCDRQLGAHYYPCGEELLEFRDDEGKEDHDMLLADGLHKRRPSELPHPRSGEPRVPMRTAFTDRAAKMREGRGVKATLMKDNHPITDWYNDAECACDICQPYEPKASGSPSHLTTFNRHTRCAKDSPAFQPFWENPVSLTFNSELATANLIHPNTHNGPPPREEECYFKSTMGRKIKSPERARSPGRPRGLCNLEDHCLGSSGVLRHRSAPGEGSLSPRPPAGCYNQDYKPEIMKCTNKTRMVFQGRAPEYGERSGVALILSPRDSDPPPPTKIVVDKKGDGVFKTKFTEAAQKRLAYHNQEVFRFADPEDVKGRPTSPPPLDNCAGVSMKQFDEIIARQHPASPKTRSRRILNNTSYIVAGTMDHDYNRDQALKLTATRHRCDEPFKSVCEYTKASKWDATLVAAEVRDAIGHIQSSQVANNLMWPEP